MEKLFLLLLLLADTCPGHLTHSLPVLNSTLTSQDTHIFFCSHQYPEEKVTQVHWKEKHANGTYNLIATQHPQWGDFTQPQYRGHVTLRWKGNMTYILETQGGGIEICCEMIIYPCARTQENCLAISGDTERQSFRTELLGTLLAGAAFTLGSFIILCHICRTKSWSVHILRFGSQQASRRSRRSLNITAPSCTLIHGSLPFVNLLHDESPPSRKHLHHRSPLPRDQMPPMVPQPRSQLRPEVPPPRKQLCPQVPPPRKQLCPDIPPPRNQLCPDVPPLRKQLCPDVPAPRNQLCPDIPPPRNQPCPDLPFLRNKLCPDIPPPRNQVCLDIKPLRNHLCTEIQSSRNMCAEISPPRNHLCSEVSPPRNLLLPAVPPPRNNTHGEILLPKNPLHHTTLEQKDQGPPKLPNNQISNETLPSMESIYKNTHVQDRHVKTPHLRAAQTNLTQESQLDSESPSLLNCQLINESVWDVQLTGSSHHNISPPPAWFSESPANLQHEVSSLCHSSVPSPLTPDSSVFTKMNPMYYSSALWPTQPRENPGTDH